jgi:predicted O-methyltransferase YrrM
MADQTFAQTGALKDPFAPKTTQEYTPHSMLAKRLRGIQCWLRYALVGRRRSVPGLVDLALGNHFFNAIQVPGELLNLGRILAALQPERALEIGTARGGTLLFLTRLASPRATILSIDLPGGRFGGGYSPRRGLVYRRFARRGQRLHLFQGDSHSASMLQRAKIALGGEMLDYLFIDGDHTYEGVKKDFETYSPLVRKGGVIALHDVAEHSPNTGCEVSRFWNELKSRYRHAEIIEDRKQGWAGIGVLYVD